MSLYERPHSWNVELAKCRRKEKAGKNRHQFFFPDSAEFFEAAEMSFVVETRNTTDGYNEFNLNMSSGMTPKDNLSNPC